MSFIYSDIIQTYGKKIARKCGYFNTGKDFELLVPYYSDIYDSLFDTLWKYFEKPTINSLTTFMYYPGAFTHFHEGHVDVVKQAYHFISQRTDNFYIVLSPANSDYVKYKYPDLNITNKSRYDLILESLQSLDKDILSKIIIDLNPMLNMDRDYNFTDLLNNFVTIYGACYHKGPHYVVCGKDKNFKILEQYTDKIKIFYADMQIEKHSKDLIKAKPFQKKTCILRFNEVKELTLFKKYFKGYYNFILNKLRAMADAIGTTLKVGFGSTTKENRLSLGLPKDHWIDAAVCTKDGGFVRVETSLKPLIIKAVGRGLRQFCSMDKFGFPRTSPKPRSKNFFGFKTGDMVKVIIPDNAKTKVPTGTYVGRVAVRSTGSFDVKTKDAKLNVSHKYCKPIHLMDGYSYA